MSFEHTTPGPQTPPSHLFHAHLLDAGLAAAFGPELTGGWSRPPQLRDDPSEFDPATRPLPADVPSVPNERYQLLGEITHGGMGAILRGHDPVLGRDLAFKVVLDEYAGNAVLGQRFVEEAQIGGQLQHPGIVPVYELGRFRDGRPYFAMKLVKGRTLSDHIAARTTPADDRFLFLRYFLQVCQTMAYAHVRGVIHRDLKPANVMVGAFGEVLVMDWGLAKVLPHGVGESPATGEHVPPVESPTDIHVRHPNATAKGAVMGTLEYMPPEQACGEVDKLDERADVFSLGGILCALLTGRPPIEVSPDVLARRVSINAHLLELRSKLGESATRLDGCGADAELVSLCKRCLAFDRDGRPRNAGEVAEAVSGYLTAVDERAHRAELDRAAAVAKAEEEVNTRREAEKRADKERALRKAILGLVAAALVVGLLSGATIWLFRRWEGDKIEKVRIHKEHAAEVAARRLREERRHHEVTSLAQALARVSPRTDRTPPHPVEVRDTPPPIDNSAFRFLEDRLVVDLRDWDDGRGAYTMTRRVRLLKVGQADVLWFRGRTTGTDLVFRCVLPNPQTARLVSPRVKERVGEQEMTASYLGVDVRDIPLDQEFEIQTFGTYWGALRNEDERWFGVIGYPGALRVSMLVLFSPRRPYTNDSRDALRVAPPGVTTAAPFDGEKTVYEAPDRSWFYWEIPSPQPNHVYKFYWKW